MTRILDGQLSEVIGKKKVIIRGMVFIIIAESVIQ